MNSTVRHFPARLACGLAALILSACSGSPAPESPRVKVGNPIFTPIPEAALSGVNTIRDMLVADVNGDRLPDVLLGYHRGTTGIASYAVYLNNGDGTFRGAAPLDRLFDARIADFDGDGRPDLFACGPTGGQAQIRFARADGPGWGDAINVPIPAGASCENPVIGDFNGDGKMDAALAVSRAVGAGLDRFVVLLGGPAGSFAAGPVQEVAGLAGQDFSTLRLRSLNLDGDARTDLLVLSRTGATGYMPQSYRSAGSGMFSRTWPTTPYADEFSRRSVMNEFPADLDGDGRIDLVLYAPAHFVPGPPVPFPPPPPDPPPPPLPSTILMALRGNGDGTFGPPAWSRLEENNQGLAVADLDRDGRPDVVAWRGQGGALSQLTVAFGRGDGTFFDEVVIASPASSASGRIAVIDLNGDGRPDVLSLNGNRLSVLLAE